ncbi:hypothetical protein [Microbacterium sp. BH-3-3-3]|uniref:hypothetical protein n=1 Tax=Microbacterium sp. BH-3-3-3 TaxID=1906742 RepID=UPI0011A948AF|nr:hypothetical protein [Microbacterium sp. BH-3-3-3]
MSAISEAVSTARRDLERADAWPRPHIATEVSEHLDMVSTSLEKLLDALSAPPADDVREALASVIADAKAHPSFPRPEGFPPLERDYRAADTILATFEVRPRGTVTDAEWEYGVRHVAVDGWPTDLVRSSLDAARADLDTCGMNCHLIRRRSAQEAGQWEAFHASCEVGS